MDRNHLHHTLVLSAPFLGGKPKIENIISTENYRNTGNSRNHFIRRRLDKMQKLWRNKYLNLCIRNNDFIKLFKYSMLRVHKNENYHKVEKMHLMSLCQGAFKVWWSNLEKSIVGSKLYLKTNIKMSCLQKNTKKSNFLQVKSCHP